MREKSGSKLNEYATRSKMARNSPIYRKKRQDTKMRDYDDR